MIVRRVVARLGQDTVDDLPRFIESINLDAPRAVIVVAVFEGAQVGSAVVSVEGDYVYADIDLIGDVEPEGVPVLDLNNDGEVAVDSPPLRIRFVACSPAAVTYTPNPAWTDDQLKEP